jgi:Major Facilitator Superfamily
MTYFVEQAPDRKRGMVVGFLPLGNLSGFVVAGLLVTGLQTGLSNHDMLTWGWRLPLLLSAPLGLVALFMRLRLEESPAYQNESQGTGASGGDQQYRRTIAEQWKPMLICAALVYTSNAADYILTGYLPTYLKVFVHIGHTAGLSMITATLTIMAILLVFIARLSDRIGVKPIMRTGLRAADRGLDPGFLAHPPRRWPPADLRWRAAGRADGTVLRQHDAVGAAGTISHQCSLRRTGYRLQHLDIPRRHHTTDRPGIGVGHRQPDGAGLHADFGGAGRRGDSAIHARSGR